MIDRNSNEEFCNTTGKRKFETRNDAQRALRNIHNRKGGNGAAYLCPDCHRWHITHLSYQRSKEIRTVKKRAKHTDEQQQQQQPTNNPLIKQQ